MSLVPLIGTRYDFWSGHFDRLDPAPSELDAVYRDAVHAFEIASRADQAAFVAVLDERDFYSIQSFSSRAAILGLRAQDRELVHAGLTAAITLDPHKIDWRDAGATLPLLGYCMIRLGMDVNWEFETALACAVPALADRIRVPIQRLAAYSSLESYCRRELMHVEVHTQKGAGFIDRGTLPFQPRRNLVDLAVQVAERVHEDARYQLDRVVCAADPPWHWLGPDLEAAPDEFAAKVRGTCSIHAALRPDVYPESMRFGTRTQQLWIAVLELTDVAAAKRLSTLANASVCDRAEMLSLSHGAICGMILGWSLTSEIPVFESKATLERYRKPLASVIESTSSMLDT